MARRGPEVTEPSARWVCTTKGMKLMEARRRLNRPIDPSSLVRSFSVICCGPVIGLSGGCWHDAEELAFGGVGQHVEAAVGTESHVAHPLADGNA